MTATTPTLLVTGAGGHLGRRVVELLLARGGARVIAGSRNPTGLSALAARGAETRRVDFDDPHLSDAFAGVDRLLIVSTDSIDVPQRRLTQHLNAVAAAKKARVARVVYTSMPKPEPGNLIPFAPDHFGTEQALAASGLESTVLRNNWYAEMLLLALPQILATGQWVTSAAEGRVGYVTREDCAQAAAAVLAGQTPANSRYNITGPESLSATEVAAIATEEFDRPIAVVHVSDDQLAEGLTAAGVPSAMASLLVGIDANTRAGNLDIVTADVRALTGRDPQRLRDFLSANTEQLLAAQ